MVSRLPMDGIAVAADEVSGREVFLQNCAYCHVTGVAMAPRIGHRGDWTERLASGRSGLLHSVLRGKGGMPPKGGNASISDLQAAAGLDYMLSRVAGIEPPTRVVKAE
jgi:cytochrome c5